jgi:hypothetical protein
MLDILSRSQGMNTYTATFLRVNKLTTNKTRNRKNNTLAIPAALAAMPENPKTAAIRATTKNVTDQLSI